EVAARPRERDAVLEDAGGVEAVDELVRRGGGEDVAGRVDGQAGVELGHPVDVRRQHEGAHQGRRMRVGDVHRPERAQRGPQAVLADVEVGGLDGGGEARGGAVAQVKADDAFGGVVRVRPAGVHVGDEGVVVEQADAAVAGVIDGAPAGEVAVRPGAGGAVG